MNKRRPFYFLSKNIKNEFSERSLTGYEYRKIYFRYFISIKTVLCSGHDLSSADPRGSTIVSATAFHDSVRNGKRWYHKCSGDQNKKQRYLRPNNYRDDLSTQILFYIKYNNLVKLLEISSKSNYLYKYR